jgi:uncharacterized protein
MRYLFLLLSMFTFLNAVSFDCVKATSNVEKSLCRVKKLSLLDDNLSNVYNEAKTLLHDSKSPILISSAIFETVKNSVSVTNRS